MTTTKQKLASFRRKGLFKKAFRMKRLANNFLSKSRHNLMISNLLKKISDSEKAQKSLDLPFDFEAYDWAVISGYYAMYHSALAALAKIGFKSDNHTATILALEVYFVQRQLLEKRYLNKLKSAKELEEVYIQKIRAAKSERETAQYSAVARIDKERASRVLEDANDFVERIEMLIEQYRMTQNVPVTEKEDQ